MKKYTLKTIVYMRRQMEKVLWMYLAKPIAPSKLIPSLKQGIRDICALVLGLIDLGLEKVQTKLGEV